MTRPKSPWGYTTISVARETRDRLSELKRDGETWEMMFDRELSE